MPDTLRKCSILLIVSVLFFYAHFLMDTSYSYAKDIATNEIIKPEDPIPNVKEITASNWGKFRQIQKLHGKFMLVQFYDPSCPWSRQFTPTFKELANTLVNQLREPENLIIAKFNCRASTAEFLLSTKLGVRSYPSLLLYSPEDVKEIIEETEEDTRPQRFGGHKKEDELEKYAKTPYEDKEASPESGDSTIKQGEEDLTATSHDYVPSGKKPKAVEFKGFRSIPEIIKFVEKNSTLKLRGSVQADGTTPVKSTSAVEDLTKNTERLHELINLYGENVAVSFVAPWCQYSKNLEPVWEEAANLAMQEGVDVHFVKFTCEADDKALELCKQYGATNFPTIQLYYGDKASPELFTKPRTVDNLIAFVKLFTERKELKKHVHDEL